MHLNSIKEKLYFGIYKWFPLKNDTVLFKSFGGQYGDNPKYISELLHEINPNINLVWGISKKSSGNDIPDYVKKVDINSLKFIKYASTAKVIIDNMSGIRGIRGQKYKSIYNYFLKRNNQLNISTWHGTPLKKIGCDILSDHINYYQTSANYMSVGNEYCHKIFKQAFHGINIHVNGTPRNDILCKKNIDKIDLKKKLGLPLDKKIILYAPTFRNSINESGLNQIKKFNLDVLFKVLNQKFGGDWIFVLRVHHEVLLSIRNECKEFIDNINVIDGNLHDDMAEYLLCSDILLTDYSSSMFDFMLTRKPCFLFAYDKDNYINDERGVYIDINDLPFSFSEDLDTLYENIQKYDETISKENIEKFLKEIGNIDDGNSSSRIVHDILEFMK